MLCETVVATVTGLAGLIADPSCDELPSRRHRREGAVSLPISDFREHQAQR